MVTDGERHVDLSHVSVIEYEEGYGSLQLEMVALFNHEKITTEDAFRYVRSGEYNDYVLCIPKRQFVALLRNEAL